MQQVVIEQTVVWLDPLNTDDHPQIIALLNHNRVVNVFHQSATHRMPNGQQVRLSSTIIVSNLNVADADLCYFVLAKKPMPEGGFALVFDLLGIFIYDSVKHSLTFRTLSPTEEKWVFKEYGVKRKIFNDPTMLRPSKVITPDEILYECSLANKLPHLATASLIGNESYRYLPMKKQAGHDLFTILEKDQDAQRYPTGMFTMRNRLELAILICHCVINQIHNKGYVHCDLKPENIIVDLRQSPYAVNIIDPGLMRKAYIQKNTNTKIGTPGFMPPETTLPNQTITPAWDIFSLGRVISMLFGINSFRKNQAGQQIEDQPNILFRSNYSRKKQILALLRKMCLTNPAKRYDLFKIIDEFCLLLTELSPNSPVLKEVYDNELSTQQYSHISSSLFKSLNVSPQFDQQNFQILLKESLELYIEEKNSQINSSYYQDLIDCTSFEKLIIYQVKKIQTLETSLKYNSFLCVFLELAQQQNYLNEIKKILNIDFISIESIRTPEPSTTSSWSQWAASFWYHGLEETHYQNARNDLFQKLSGYVENIESNKAIGEGFFY